MQSRHPRPGSRPWPVHPELDRFLAEVDTLLSPPDIPADHLPVTWPPPAIRRTLFPYGVFTSRALVRHP